MPTGRWTNAARSRRSCGPTLGRTRRTDSQRQKASSTHGHHRRRRRNHDELFPDHVSTLAPTDPELIEYFDNFAFDEVLRHGSLDARTRLMVQLAALIAARRCGEYRVMAGAALTVGVTPVEIKEIVYQAVPYVGMGKVFDFLHATNEVLTERGVELPLPGQSTTTPQTRLEQGPAVQGEIVGHAGVDAMYANAPADLAHIQRYLSGNCFGDHLTRDRARPGHPRADHLRRCSISLGGCDPQVKGHVRGNLNVGNDRAAADRGRHPAAAVHRLPTHR